jgi:hypothetical protein
MKRIYLIDHIMCVIIMCAILISCIGVVSGVEYNNTGQGKPRGMDIFLGDIPYSASLGGNDQTSTEKGVADFKVIVDDNKVGKPDPEWFDNLGAAATSIPTSSPTPTPTMTPTPTATAVIEISAGGVGAQLCALDNTSDVIVDFAYSDAWYENVFKLSSPHSAALGKNTTLGVPPGTAFGTTWNLGKFTPGQELIFSDTANGKTYYTGPASRNPDKMIHGAITLKNATGTYHKYLVTFEDSWNGGDKDYNDLEFYVNGNVSTSCSASTSDDSSSDSGGGAVIPVYVENSVCKCSSPGYDSNGKTTCVAQFTYANSAGKTFTIPIHASSLPWNEFTGSGMVEQFRCQPTMFYVNASTNSPFWTNRFWNNIKWKLGNVQSVLVKCDRSTPPCANNSTACTECLHYNNAR